MQEHPIIFSADMVKAILDGVKKQTRRVIKPQPIEITDEFTPNGYRIGKLNEFPRCPYGGVGDRLWVRETWSTEKQYDHLKPSEIPDTSKIYFIDKSIHSAGGYSLFVEMGKIRSSMFMCKWMSRITLEITEVRVERVQEITEEDVRAEGIAWEGFKTNNGHIRLYGFHNGGTTTIPQSAFKELWDSLNAKRGYGWEINPWVWAISFKLLQQPREEKK